MGSLRDWIVCVGVLVLASLAVAPASAQPRTPRDDARAALRQGRFEDALRLFRTAAERDPDPSAWLEVGDAADRLRADAVALEAYERYLAARPDASDRVEVLARIDVLRAVLGRASSATPARPGFIATTTILEALETTPPPATPGLGRRLHAP